MEHLKDISEETAADLAEAEVRPEGTLTHLAGEAQSSRGWSARTSAGLL